jgi:hypothetical protein
MSTITINEKAGPYCLWCGSTKPAAKAGWIEHSLPSGAGIKFHFCSRKCLASATLSGKGRTLDIGRIAAHRQQKERRQILSRFKEILQKDRMSESDFPVFFLALSAKQKRTLALIGLTSMATGFARNPKRILAEINRLGE